MTSKIEVPREFVEVIANSCDHTLEEINAVIQQARAMLAAPEAPRQGDELDASAERNAMQRQRDSALSELKRECDNTDAALRLLGFDPHVFRTDGGSLNLSKLRSSVAPLSPGHSGGGAGVVANDELQAIQDRHEAWKAGEAHGIESAARLIEKRMEDYINEHGSFDPETGAVEFPGNGEEYVGELVEISEAIRALDKVKELNQ